MISIILAQNFKNGIFREWLRSAFPVIRTHFGTGQMPTRQFLLVVPRLRNGKKKPFPVSVNGTGNRKRVCLIQKFPSPFSRPVFPFFKKIRFPFQTRFCDGKNPISVLISILLKSICRLKNCKITRFPFIYKLA